MGAREAGVQTEKGTGRGVVQTGRSLGVISPRGQVAVRACWVPGVVHYPVPTP
jgi:hypothetical protein